MSIILTQTSFLLLNSPEMSKILDASWTTSSTIRSFLPIFYISKYFGSNLYQLPKTLNAANINTNIRGIDICICLVQLGLAFGFSFPLIEKWADKESPTRRQLESIISLFSVTILLSVGSVANYGYIIVYLVIMFVDMINAPVIHGILFLFGNFDEEAGKHGVKIDFSYRYMTIAYVAIVLTSQIMVLAFSFELLAKQDNGHIGMVVKIYLGNVMTDGCIYSFYMTYWLFLENVAKRINFLNQRLRQHMGRTFNRTGQVITGDSGNAISVRDLSTMHHILSNIIRKINYCYALQFVLCTAITFFFTVMNFFISYKTLTLNGEYHTSLLMILFYMSRSFYCNYYFYKIIEVGSSIKNMKLITQSLLNKANILCGRENDQSEIKSFSYQLSHSNLEINCGFFPVDWTLFYTILSATGTYLLWFIQFDNMGATGTVTVN